MIELYRTNPEIRWLLHDCFPGEDMRWINVYTEADTVRDPGRVIEGDVSPSWPHTWYETPPPFVVISTPRGRITLRLPDKSFVWKPQYRTWYGRHAWNPSLYEPLFAEAGKKTGKLRTLESAVKAVPHPRDAQAWKRSYLREFAAAAMGRGLDNWGEFHEWCSLHLEGYPRRPLPGIILPH